MEALISAHLQTDYLKDTTMVFLLKGKMIGESGWSASQILTSINNSNNQFDIIQAQIDFFKVPPDLGRIPNKIHSGFASFTAEQWKIWTIYFSVASTHDLLDKAVLECWRHFVLACRIILLMNTISNFSF